MKEVMIVRKKRAAQLRRMAETAQEVERQRKLLALADKWDEEAGQLGDGADGASARCLISSR
jgi:hypothetical protein